MRTVSRERFQNASHLVCSYYSLTERISEIMFEMEQLCKDTELRWGTMPPCAVSDDWVVDQKNIWGSQVDTCDVGVIAWVSQTSMPRPRCTPP